MKSTLRLKLGNLLDVPALFLKLGATAFGGSAVHISLMEQEAVVRRGWLSREEFLDLVGVVNMIPGPKSTELALFLGYRRAGFAGLLLAGICFILPAALIVSVIAWAYVKFGKMAEMRGVFYGVKPIIIAVIVQAIWKLGRTAVRTPILAVIGVGAAALSSFGANPLLVFLFAGLLTAAIHLAAKRRQAAASLAPFLGKGAAVPLAAAAATPFNVWAMTLLFLKTGCLLFGGSYVLLAFLHADLFGQRHWLTESQLLDAVAAAQFSPGPVLTTVTFTGYLLGGPKAALLATAAILLPAFVLVAASGPIVTHIRKSPLAGAVLDGMNIAALALVAVVAWQLGRAALVDWLTITLAVAAAIWLLRYRVNSTWLLLGGAALGLARFVFQTNP